MISIYNVKSTSIRHHGTGDNVLRVRATDKCDKAMRLTVLPEQVSREDRLSFGGRGIYSVRLQPMASPRDRASC
jgi:hypothetical protein